MYDLPDDDEWIPERRRAIGDRLRKERHRQKVTQDQVWLAARVSRYTLQRVEAGEEMELSTLLRIIRVLGLSLGDLD